MSKLLFEIIDKVSTELSAWHLIVSISQYEFSNLFHTAAWAASNSVSSICSSMILWMFSNERFQCNFYIILVEETYIKMD